MVLYLAAMQQSRYTYMWPSTHNVVTSDSFLFPVVVVLVSFCSLNSHAILKGPLFLNITGSWLLYDAP